jgi:tRNA A37 threonylcarbamoyladenosine dehydratase
MVDNCAGDRMQNQFVRTQMLLGAEAMATLEKAHVIVFGIGGVGGSAVEGLVRAGVGHIDIVDDDVVSPSNINRQIIATTSNVGRSKVEVMAERIRDINPQCEVTCHTCFYLPATAGRFDFARYDYVVDAVDTVTAKLQLVKAAQSAGTSIISAMGTANKLDPTALAVGDIYETSICPLARIMRKECRKRGIDHLKVVFSTEPAMRPVEDVPTEGGAEGMPLGERPQHAARRDLPGSVSWVPPVAGFIIAGEVVKDLIGR